VRALPHHAPGRNGEGGQLVRLEDGVFGKDEVSVQHFVAVGGVREGVDDGVGGGEPAEVVEEGVLVARLDDDEEVKVGKLVEPVEFQTYGALADEGEGGRDLGEGSADGVEAGEQALGGSLCIRHAASDDWRLVYHAAVNGLACERPIGMGIGAAHAIVT
jgi:hypothetical protein